MSRCKGCGKEIKWIKTLDGQNIPVDVERIRIVTKEGEVVGGYSPHFVTCPKADEFRR